MKKVIFVIFNFFFTCSCCVDIAFGEDLFTKAEEFITHNEVSGVWRLKAYKDTRWTICNGITYYIVKNKMKGGFKGHECKPIDKNNLHKGYVCQVKKNDLLLLKECRKQSKIHIDYIIDKLSNKLLIGKSGVNWWNKLNDNQKIVLIDVLFNYGETNKDVKTLLKDTMDMVKNTTKLNQIQFYSSQLKLCEMSKIKKKYQAGQTKRCNRRIVKFFSE